MGYVSVPPDATIDTKIATHNALAQNVHGVGANDVQGANDMTTHAGLTQNVHGAGAYDIQDSNDIAVHAALAQNVHGAGAYDIQDSNDIAVHAALTQNVHGAGANDIADLNDLASYAKMNNGTYTGNSSVNRAIPHGLGVVPKIVNIHIVTHSWYIFIIPNVAFVFLLNATDHYSKSVTVMDATNFYVGNSGDYEKSANLNAVGYRWEAEV